MGQSVKFVVGLSHCFGEYIQSSEPCRSPGETTWRYSAIVLSFFRQSSKPTSTPKHDLLYQMLTFKQMENRSNKSPKEDHHMSDMLKNEKLLSALHA